MFYGTKWRKPKNARSKLEASRKSLPRGRFRRATAQIQVQGSDEVVAGRVFLHDISVEGLGVFLTRPLDRGEQVFVVLNEPRHLFVRGKVIWCGLYQLNTRVISEQNYQYRARIQFEFESQAERETLTNYFEQIAS